MAILEITLQIAAKDRPAAAAVYAKYKEPFLTTIAGATAKRLLVREEDVQVLHEFDTLEQARAYLGSTLLTRDVVGELAPLLAAPPDVRIYESV